MVNTSSNASSPENQVKLVELLAATEKKVERETGFEPATPSLEGSRSTN